MPIVKTSAKGQVVIPTAFRQKIGLKPGARVLITLTDQDTVILRPVPDNPIQAACGLLKGGPSLTQALLKERQEDRKREEAKYARLVRPDGISRQGKRVRKGQDPAA